jgi:hypothetical protein
MRTLISPTAWPHGCPAKTGKPGIAGFTGERAAPYGASFW